MRTRCISWNRWRAILFLSALAFFVKSGTPRIGYANDPQDSHGVQSEIEPTDTLTTERSSLRSLRDEVQSLRADVRRLCELIEKHRTSTPSNSDIKSVNPGNESTATSDTLRRQKEERELKVGANQLLIFTAAWCGPCQQMNPTITKLIRAGLPIQQIDVDRNKDLARQHRVETIPCSVLIMDGKEIARKNGLQNELDLQALIKVIDTLAATAGPADAASTSHERGELLLRSYPIADLLLTFAAIDSTGEETRPPKITMAKWLEVIDLITTTIEPQCWKINGGQSTIATEEKTFSLIIRARFKTHQEIHDLLSQIRRKQDIQICTEICWIRNVDNDILVKQGINVQFDPTSKAAKLTSANVKQFRGVTQERVLYAPKVTSFNNQVSQISDHSGNGSDYLSEFRLFYRAKVLEDQNQIRFNLAFNPVNLVDELIAPAVFLADGEYVLFDVNELIRQKCSDFTPSTKTFVMICPRVFIQQDEEVDTLKH